MTGLAVDFDVRDRGIEPEDFDWIVRRHQKRIYRVVFFILRDPECADILTQECFLRAFEKRDSFRGEASLQTWLVRIAINLAYDHVKSRRFAFWKRLVRGREGFDAKDPHGSPEQIMLAREQASAVWSAVNRLSEQQRTAFLLRFAEEMSLEEVAAAMSLEVGTVKSHLYRALGTVRQSLKVAG